jgi:hypothetical protein
MPLIYNMKLANPSANLQLVTQYIIVSCLKQIQYAPTAIYGL